MKLLLRFVNGGSKSRGTEPQREQHSRDFVGPRFEKHRLTKVADLVYLKRNKNDAFFFSRLFDKKKNKKKMPILIYSRQLSDVPMP